MGDTSVESVRQNKKIPLKFCVLCCFYTPVTECSGTCMNCEVHMCEDCMLSEHVGLVFCSLYCVNGGIVDTPDSLCLHD